MLFDKNWFEKHQSKLLFLLNTPFISLWFRWILRINGNKSSVGNRKITAINPNSITWEVKRTKKQIISSTEFRTHDKFSKRLYYAFKPFWYLLHFFDWAALDRIEYLTQFSFGFSTLTVYPDAGKPGTTSVDGEIAYRASASYATAHDAATGTHLDSEGTGLLSVENSLVGTYYISRSLTNFDTSALSSSATITAAVLSLYGNSVANADTDSVSIVIHSITSNTDYSLSDWGSFGTTKQASDIANASISTIAYNDFSLNATGLSNINKTGISKFAQRTAKDIANTAPTGSNYVTFKSADTTGTANDPKLVVTYGSSYTKILTENPTFTDSLLKATIRNLSENPTFTVNVYKATIKVLTESATFTETILRDITKVFSETITFTDTLVKAIDRTLTESATFTVTLLKGIEKTFTETATFTISLIKRVGRTATNWIKQVATAGGFTKQTPTSSPWTKEEPTEGDWV